jgi:hypothetical protein
MVLQALIPETFLYRNTKVQENGKVSRQFAIGLGHQDFD